MHQAMVRMDGEKMSKSLGNLVFISELRKTWDVRAIRLAIVAHHYRDSWEWHDEIMPISAARLELWLAATNAPGAVDSQAALDEVRARLDDDLDTPGAVEVIDRAVERGEGVASAAKLLGVFLVGEPQR
jgi:L-cysteine:1D-myo-inositol 2-amino-2-deoxy-alpha-D-glucopyranoside ligase